MTLIARELVLLLRKSTVHSVLGDIGEAATVDVELRCA